MGTTRDAQMIIWNDGRTIAQISKAIGVSYTTLWNFMNTKNAKDKTIERVLKPLGYETKIVKIEKELEDG